MKLKSALLHIAAIFLIAFPDVGCATPRPAGHIPGIGQAPAPVVPSCPGGLTFTFDGCAAANQNASFTVLSRFAATPFAHLTAGQTWTSVHPQPFNVAGWDYPVGYDKATSLKDWTSTTPPVGCSFQATGNPFTSGPWIKCDGTGAVAGAQIVFDGWDFTTCYQGDQTKCGGEVRVSSSKFAKITFTNNKFLLGSNLNASSGYNISAAAGDTGNDLDVEGNEFDGGHAAWPCTITATFVSSLTLHVTDGGTCGASAKFNSGQLVAGGGLTKTSGGTAKLNGACQLSGGAADCALSGNSATQATPSTVTVEMADVAGAISWQSINDHVTVKNNAFYNQPSLDGSITGTGSDVVWDFNYTDALALNTVSVVHVATVAVSTGSAVGATVNSLEYKGNFTGYGASGASTPGGGSTCFSVLGTTAKYTYFGNVTIVGNTCVNDLLTATGGPANSSGLFFMIDVAGVTGTFEAHDNFVDPTGALSCVSNAGDMTASKFWVDDGSAGAASDSGVAGNVFHIAADADVTRGVVYVGSNIGSSSVVYGPVLPYGTGGTTGTGLSGTYLFTGTPIHVAPTGAGGAGATVTKTWDSPVTGALSLGPSNKVATNMRDGSDIDFVGVQWNLGACNGHQ